MELRHLLTFVTATELQSFTRAAHILGVTQAAVSQHVAALEKELSVSLFNRASRAVVSTDAGRMLYEYAREIIDLADEACDRITHAPNVVVGVLKIAASTVPSEWLLPELLVEFHALHSQVRAVVSVSDSTDAIRAVESGEAELALVGELPREGNLVAKVIASDELALVVPQDHAFVEKKKVSLDEFRSAPLIVREQGSGSRRCVEQALSKCGLSPSELNIVIEVNSNEVIRAAVEQGAGMAFLSTRAVARDIRDGRLVPVKIETVEAKRHLYVITDPERMPTRVAREFLSFLGQRH